MASEFEGSAQTLKVLGHPVRLKIVAGLEAHPCCVRDIWSCLGMPQALVSQHLAILKTHGIIAGTRRGVEMHYTVVDPLAKRIVDSLHELNFPERGDKQ